MCSEGVPLLVLGKSSGHIPPHSSCRVILVFTFHSVVMSDLHLTFVLAACITLLRAIIRCDNKLKVDHYMVERTDTVPRRGLLAEMRPNRPEPQPAHNTEGILFRKYDDAYVVQRPTRPNAPELQMTRDIKHLFRANMRYKRVSRREHRAFNARHPRSCESYDGATLRFAASGRDAQRRPRSMARLGAVDSRNDARNVG